MVLYQGIFYLCAGIIKDRNPPVRIRKKITVLTIYIKLFQEALSAEEEAARDKSDDQKWPEYET